MTFLVCLPLTQVTFFVAGFAAGLRLGNETFTLGEEKWKFSAMIVSQVLVCLTLTVAAFTSPVP